MTVIERGLDPALPFTMVPNDTARDRRLSSRARGVLTYLLSHKAGFQLNSDVLASEFHDLGRDAMRSVMTELREAGYLERGKRNAGGGHWEWWYRVHPVSLSTPECTPVPAMPVNVQVAPSPEIPATAEPATAEPAPVNTAIKEDQPKEDQQDLAPSPSEMSPAGNSNVVSIRKPPTRRTRCPADFTVDDGMRAWASEKAPDVDLASTTEAFVDYFVADGKPKADWRRAWQVWLRREQERAGRPAARGQVINKAAARNDMNFETLSRLRAQEAAGTPLALPAASQGAIR